MTTYEPEVGSIVHIELFSDDRAATQSFYEDAFGWEFERYDEIDYLMWRAPDLPGGAVVDPADAPFPAPSTLCYLGTDDLSSTAAAIEEAGGELLTEETDVLEMGAFVVFRAPGDVVAAVWQSHPGTEPDEPMLFTDDPGDGSVSHVELYSTDPAETESFFETVFDWRVEPTGDGDYTMAYPPTPPYAGVRTATDELPAGILIYLGVPNVEAATRTIQNAGGAVRREPFVVDGWGRIAVIEAPGGIVNAVWQDADEFAGTDAEMEGEPAP